MKKFIKITAISAVAMTGLVAAAQPSLAADQLEIRDFVGTINWSNGPMSVEIEKNAGETEISGRRSVVVDGGQNKIDGSDCQSAYGRYDINWFGKRKQGNVGGYKNLEDLPVLNITLPEDAKLILGNSIVFTAGAPNIAEADLALSYCGDVTLGDISGQMALDSRGSADVDIGKSGQLVASLKGSGDLAGGDSGDVLIKSHGSADIDLGDVKSLEAALHGSGDLSAGVVGGAAELSSQGSGDVELDEVNGRLSYASYGSGDLDVSAVTGASLEVESYGSGDIDIGGGEVDELIATVRGSATIEFSGEAQTANLRATGSGDIYIDRVAGAAEIKTSGSGDVEIDNRG